jgi:hypothetical protein
MSDESTQQITGTSRFFTRATHEDGGVTITEIMNDKYYTPEIEKLNYLMGI